MRVHPTLSQAERPKAAQPQGATPMMLTLGFLLAATVLGVAGQLILKHGMTQMGALQIDLASVPTLIWRMLTSPYVFGGLMVYACGTFFWLLVLNRVPISFSYPFISLGIVLGLFSAWAIFHEQIPPQRWLGMAVICLGVLVVARS